MPQQESIESSGFPLAFKVRQGAARPGVIAGRAGRDVLLAEARMLAGHQKECVVHEGAEGSVWRLVSDEGAQLKGTDLAPFPLGFYNAGLHGDLANRILTGARARGIRIDSLEIGLDNGYSMTGSFFRGNGKGYGEPAEIRVRLRSPASAEAVTRLIHDAAKASPALACMGEPLTNTFALYVNGRRRPVTMLPNSSAPDAADPFVTYARAPEPLAGGDHLPDIIFKPGATTQGEFALQPAETRTRVQITVMGRSRLLDPAGVTETYLRLGFPGTSHFVIKSDERAHADQAPSGLALVSAGIVFCYMTQLSRYIEHMKFKIRGVRVVQTTPYAVTGAPEGSGWAAQPEPVDTHLFLSGEESDETYEQLMTVAANTCYLHATLGDCLPPRIAVEHDALTPA